MTELITLQDVLDKEAAEEAAEGEFFLQVVRALNQTSGIADPEQWLLDALGGGRSKTGQRVTYLSALGIPTVWSAVGKIMGHVGMSPLMVRVRVGKGSEPLPTHQVSRLWNVATNDELGTPMGIKETLQLHALLEGNGRAYITRQLNGRPDHLTIMPAESSWSMMIGGQKFHACTIHEDYSPELNERLMQGTQTQPSGTGGPWRTYTIPDSEVWHLMGRSWNGLWGMDVTQVMKTALGIGQAGQDSVAFSFNNNGKPGLLIEAPRKILRTKEEADEFIRHFIEQHSGPENKGKVGLLREGMKAVAMPMSNVDAQLNELAKMTAEDIALIFGTEYLMGEAAAVYKDLESRRSAYHGDTLAPWFKRWTCETDRKLLSGRERSSGRYFTQFDTIDLLRTSLASLADYTGSLRTQGAINGNEVRDIHGFNEVDDEQLESYGNPNTSSGDDPPPEDDDGESGENAGETDQPDQQLQQAFDHVMSQKFAYQDRRVRAMAKQATSLADFRDRVVRFYGSFDKQVSETVEAFGGDPSVAYDFTQESQSQLLTLSGSINTSQLVGSVSDLLDTWKERRLCLA